MLAERRPAIISEAYVSLSLRCTCPICQRLDARYPGEGYQLALFAYRRQLAPTIPKSRLRSRQPA